MADFISPILSVISLICSCSGRNICYLCDLKENQDALKTAVKELKNKRDDVKRQIDYAETNPNERKKRTHEVNGWLELVQTTDDEVVGILQKVDEQITGRCLGGYCPKSCWSDYKVGKLMIQKLACVEELKRRQFDNLTYNLPPPPVQEMNVEPTVGMESMFEKVWRFVSTDDVKTMGLYGQGGVGKTRLLKEINNEFLRTTHIFDVVILVVVSRVLNVEAIQKKIGERLGLSWEQDNKDEAKRAEEIFNVLKMKNFVLLMDDIWEKIDLQRIGVPRPVDKSKIIFTTRSETVCGLMEANYKFKVKCLPWDKAWSLFQEKVGKEVFHNPLTEVFELAKIVAKQCGGLPLALITIGLAMSNKISREEWNDAITRLNTSASKFQGMGDTVLPLLKLSYDNLHDETTKSCFLYCSLFPEDYSIDKAQLIDFWFVEGFLDDCDNIDEARNHGYTVIGSLKAACLLENGIDEETHVKMHDSIRDLALWITNDFGNKVDKYLFSLNMSGTWKKSERIFLMVDEAGKEIKKAPESPNLLSLLVYGDPFFLRFLPSAECFFQITPFLRVLDLSNSKMKTVPKSITDLLELEYLGLSRTSITALPRALSRLVKLKYLDLSHTYTLGDIPIGLIASLSELQVLNLHFSSFGDWELTYFVSLQELVSLEQLHDLRITINNCKALWKLLYEWTLNRHVRSLTLMKCEGLKSVAVARYTLYIMSTTLGFLNNLKDLKFFRCVDLEVLILEEHDSSPILETLSLVDLPKLNMITVKNQTPQEVSMSFRNLNSIVIMDCDVLKELTWLAYCLNLKKLVIHRCEGIKEIIGDGSKIEQSLVTNRVFYCLKTVELYNLPNLKSICRHTLAFPSLESMEVGYCPELKKLPFSDLPCKFNNTMQGIKGGTKWWNELQWEDENLKYKILPYFQGKPWECVDNQPINTRSDSSIGGGGGGGDNVADLILVKRERTV